MSPGTNTSPPGCLGARLNRIHPPEPQASAWAAVGSRGRPPLIIVPLVAWALSALTGCIPPPPFVGCTENLCDDGDGCTVDTCRVIDGVPTCFITPIECNIGECDRETGECVIAEDCDDDDPCTNDSIDEAAGECVHAAIECPENLVCDPATGGCITDACDGVDCDDANFCTIDSCDPVTGACGRREVDCEACDPATGNCCDDDDICTLDLVDPDTGACVNLPVACPSGRLCDPETGSCITIECTIDADCDDGLFCNGVEVCTNCECRSTTPPCSGVTEVCDEDDDVCATMTCAEDADCDDGLFCNGEETCDIEIGECVAGDPPCACPPECEDCGWRCDEDRQECDYPVEGHFDLTSGTDDFTGGCGASVFDGQLDIVGGNFFQTLNNADRLDGGGGTDTLNVQFQGGGTTTPAALLNLEVINGEVTDTNATTLSMVNADSIGELHSNSGEGAMTVEDVQTAPTVFGMSNNSEDFTVQCVAAALSAPDDETTLKLRWCTAGTFTFGPATGTNGYEILNVVSDGTVANVLTDIAQGGATSLHAITVAGAQDVHLGGGLDDSVTTVDASAATGNVTATIGNNVAIVTGGTGDDTFIFGDNYSTADTIDGGDGGDTLVLTSDKGANTTTVQPGVSNIETVLISDALVGNLNALHFGATNLSLTGNATQASTLTMPSGGTFTLLADTGEAVSCTASPNTNSDALNVDLLADFDPVDDDNFVATTFETVTLEPIGGPRTMGGNVQLGGTANEEVLIVIGSQNLTIDGFIIADRIDASTLTGSLTLNTPYGGRIDSGSGQDVLSVAGALVSSHAGNDTIRVFGGGTVMTGGTGVDSLVFIDAVDDTTNDAGDNVIMDFAFGVSTDTMTFDASGLGGLNGGMQSPVTPANYHEGSIADASPAFAYSVMVITDQAYTSVDAFEQALSARMTDTGDAIVVFFNTTAARAELCVDSNLAADNDIAAADRIVSFDNVTTLDQMTDFTNTDFIFGA